MAENAMMEAKKMMGKMGNGGMGESGMTEKQPGSSTETLVNAIKSLQGYTKMVDPQDPDVGLVRKIISEISRLIAKDQEEGQGTAPGYPPTQEGTMMNGGGILDGAPQMPSLDSIVNGGGMGGGMMS